jgi:hypothetical protein
VCKRASRFVAKRTPGTETRKETPPLKGWHRGGDGVKADVGRPGGLRPIGIKSCYSGCWRNELATLLGRRRYGRREGVDTTAGYRDGYVKPRQLSLSMGAIAVRRSRVHRPKWNESPLLPLFQRQTEAMGQLLPQLSSHGLALNEFDLAPCGSLDEGASLSVASVARRKAGWEAEYELWRTRSLADLRVHWSLRRRDLRRRTGPSGQRTDRVTSRDKPSAATSNVTPFASLGHAARTSLPT